MTEKELSQLYWLNRETVILQKELRDIEFELENCDGYKSNKLSHAPARGNFDLHDKICELLDEKRLLKDSIELNLIKIQRERARLEKYIGEIEDSEIRLIFRLRCINCMGWEDISAEMMILDDSGNVLQKRHRTTISKIFFKFLENSHTSHVSKL